MLHEDVLHYFKSYLDIPITKAISAVLLGSFGLILVSSYSIIRDIIRPYFSPLRILKGPGGGSFLFGHLKIARQVKIPGEWHQEQMKNYGPVLVYKGWFNTDRLMTNDPKAIQYVLTNSMTYLKPPELRYNLGNLLGEGLLFAEGMDHKRQRRIMNPAFGVLHIRDMTEIFVAKSLELRDALTSLIDSTPNEDGWAPVEMLSYLSSTTLDIIGLAGFNYSFNSIQSLQHGTRTESELSLAFNRVLNSLERPSFLSLLKMFMPAFRLITWDERTRTRQVAENSIAAIGSRLVREKRAALQMSDEKTKAKDLLTLLIKANMTGNADSVDRSLSDEEVMQQIPTFLLAGHETTSTSTTWALMSLALHPDIQDKLRQELLEVPTENPTMDELNALPYLERFVREALRFHSVVPGTNRIATQDDIIPTSGPSEDKYGNIHHGIKVAKGDGIIIPVRGMNTSSDIWGPDANKFKCPDRWLNPPEKSAAIPGVWGNQLSFLGGSRACIGFRFALVEMKALLFELVRSFEFKLAVPEEDIVGVLAIVMRPSVVSQKEKGSQMPMLIRKITPARKEI